MNILQGFISITQVYAKPIYVVDVVEVIQTTQSHYEEQ